MTGGTLAGSAVARLDVNGSNTAVIDSAITGGSGLTKSGTGVLELGGPNSFASLHVAGGIVATSNAGALGGGTVTLDNGTALAALSSQTIGNAITLSGGTATIYNTGHNLSLTGGIGGAGALVIGYDVFAGFNGSTTLAAGNTYGGGTTVRGTNLVIGADSALGLAGTGLTLDLGSLETTASFTSARNIALLNGGGQFVTDAGTTLTLSGLISGTSLFKVGDGTLVLGNPGNSYTGGTNIGGGVLAGATNGAFGSGNIVFSGASTLRTDGAINFSQLFYLNAAATIDTNGFNSSITGGSVNGAGSLTKIGAGELELTGSSSYGGGTIVNGGSLRIEDGNSIGSGSLTLGDGTQLSAGIFSGATFTLTNPLILTGSATINLFGSATFVASYDTDGSTTNGTTLTLAGVVSGSGPLVVGGASGRLILNGDNTYTGGTTIDSTGGNNFVYVGNDHAFGTGAISVTGGGGLSGAVIVNDSGSAHTLANGINVVSSLFGFGGANQLTLAGPITGTGTTIKLGTGTTILTNAGNSLGGTLEIGGGRLQVDGALTNAGLAVNIDSGASLGGTGSIAGTVNVGGGSLAPGDSPGTLTVGGLTQTGASTLNYEFGQAGVAGGLLNDRIIVTNNWTLDGTINVAESAGGSFTPGFYNIGTYGGSILDNGLNVGTVANGLTAVVDVNTTTKQVNLIASGGAFSVVQYWDGTDQGLTAGIQGGNGTWDPATQTNWTDATGNVFFNAHWQGDVGVFNAPTSSCRRSRTPLQPAASRR